MKILLHSKTITFAAIFFLYLLNLSIELRIEDVKSQYHIMKLSDYCGNVEVDLYFMKPVITFMKGSLKIANVTIIDSMGEQETQFYVYDNEN